MAEPQGPPSGTGRRRYLGLGSRSLACGEDAQPQPRFRGRRCVGRSLRLGEFRAPSRLGALLRALDPYIDCLGQIFGHHPPPRRRSRGTDSTLRDAILHGGLDAAILHGGFLDSFVFGVCERPPLPMVVRFFWFLK